MSTRQNKGRGRPRGSKSASKISDFHSQDPQGSQPLKIKKEKDEHNKARNLYATIAFTTVEDKEAFEDHFRSQKKHFEVTPREFGLADYHFLSKISEATFTQEIQDMKGVYRIPDERMIRHIFEKNHMKIVDKKEGVEYPSLYSFLSSYAKESQMAMIKTNQEEEEKDDSVVRRHRPAILDNDDDVDLFARSKRKVNFKEDAGMDLLPTTPQKFDADMIPLVENEGDDQERILIEK